MFVLKHFGRYIYLDTSTVVFLCFPLTLELRAVRVAELEAFRGFFSIVLAVLSL